MPLASKLQFADIGPVPQNGVQRTTGELRKRLTESSSFVIEFGGKTVERQAVIREQFKNATNVWARLGVNFHDATTVYSDVSIILAGRPLFVYPNLQLLRSRMRNSGYALTQEGYHLESTKYGEGKRKATTIRRTLHLPIYFPSIRYETFFASRIGVGLSPFSSRSISRLRQATRV